MIISFSIENWLSFRDPVCFSMIASKERQHSDRVSKIKKYNTRILPIAAIYGGNASGKTNLIQALDFVKHMVINGTNPEGLILTMPYLLDDTSDNKPSRFKLELLIDNCIYEFSFAVTQNKVVEEKLIQILTTREKILYNRQGNEITFDKTFVKDERLKFAFQGTRENQLFLTNTISQQIDHFKPVYNWFKNYLIVIFPDSNFNHSGNLFDDNNPLSNTMSEILAHLDTGIVSLGGEEIPFENLPLHEDLKRELQEKVVENECARIKDHLRKDFYFVERKSGKLIAKKLVTFHLNKQREAIKFNIYQESDGSRRMIDLLPAFLELSEPSSKTVLVIDEFDRSLHSSLVNELIKAYLTICSVESRKQLLMTTHNLLSMDQELLRRDEMWITERKSDGNSTLMSFNDYKDVRYDKDIRKSYLQGRLGGIPNILLDDARISRKENT